MRLKDAGGGGAALITAVVVTYNSSAVLKTCLTALLAAGASVIVVDNNSIDTTPEIAENMGVRVIRNDKNLGYGKANNIGVHAAITDYVLICNPDAILKSGALAIMLSAAESRTNVGLVGPKLLDIQGRVTHKSTSMLNQNHIADTRLVGEVSHVPFLIGACYLIRRSTFLDVGGFDDNIFLYYEDDDLCRRLNDKNKLILYAHSAEVIHTLGGSTPHITGLIQFVRFHQAWSKAYIARKYKLSSPVLALLVSNGFKYAWAWLTGNRKRQERYLGAWIGAAYFLRGKPPISTF